jgi:diaminopimelate decarboxylase
MIEISHRPAGTIVGADAASLCDHELAALARKHGTPLFIYNLSHLRARVGELLDALAAAEVRLFFATMANDRPAVLRLLAGEGLGACVNSLPHLQLAMDSGFKPERIQFTSTGISRSDMGALRRLRVRVNLDSLSQLEQWFDLGGPEASVRVNAASLGRGLRGDRIGVEASRVAEAQEAAARFGRHLTGLHIYLGTNFQRHDEMLPTLEAFFNLAARIGGLRYLNIGGGIGVNYKHDGSDFDVAAFGVGLERLARRLRERLGRQVEVIIEPGRGLAAGCGTFVTSVTDLKDLEGRRFAAVDGSIAIFPRPFHNPDTPHRIRQVATETSFEDYSYVEATVVGRTTFSRDILGTAQFSKSLRVGDLLAFDDAGAYSQSMASRFLGQPEPAVVFLD